MSSYLHYSLCTFIIFHFIIASGQSPLNPDEIRGTENEIRSDNNEIKGTDVQSSKIALQSSKICPKVEKVNDLYGYVKSPNYPEEYPDGVECVYTITVPEGNTVKLVLYDLHMYPGCCDFLYIYNGKEMKRKNLISRANGNGNFTSDAKSLNISYTTTDANVMTLKFTTDPQHHDRGFYARYDAIPASNSDPASTICPNEEHEGEFGVIVSPKWPNNYHPQALCHYKVTVPEGKKVFLRINFFETEDIWDHLNIYDGNSTSSTKMASLSGVTKAGTTYKTSGRNAYLTFTSNPTVQKQGYSITYQAVTG